MNKQFLQQQASEYHVDAHPRAWGGSAGRGLLRAVPEDFFVEEELGFEPEGEGEHLYVFIEKRQLNTQDVAETLRKMAGVEPADVGYAGLKDRRAVTRQWFSLRLADARDPDFSSIENTSLRLLHSVRGRHKLQRGDLDGNRFVLVIRNFQGDRARAESILQSIQTGGFPNYFGAQRFGRDNSNLFGALEVFEGRRLERWLRGICLSAARSLLFNQVLDARVSMEKWNSPLEGDVFEIAGTGSCFLDFSKDLAAMSERCRLGEIHPTGPLCGGRPRTLPRSEAKTVEALALQPYAEWCSELEKQRVAASRRSLRGFARDLGWSVEKDTWELRFSLGSGSYATALLREWVEAADKGGG